MHYAFEFPHKDINARMCVGNLQLYVKSTRKSEWFKCKLVNNAKRGSPAYCTPQRSRTLVAMETVIYIVLFARTKVAMKANKMLLIIQWRVKADEGLPQYH